MSDDSLTKRIRYMPRAFPQHVRMGGGLLPDRIESHALWGFCAMAHVALDKVEGQITYEGDKDQTILLSNIAKSVLLTYGIKDLETLFNAELLWLCKREAARCDMAWNPKLDLWINSGGKNMNEVTRDPNALN